MRGDARVAWGRIDCDKHWLCRSWVSKINIQNGILQIPVKVRKNF